MQRGLSVVSSALVPNALASLALLACAPEREPAGPPFELEIPVTRSTLDNGLELVVVPNHTSPVVTALVAVRTGAFVEDASNNGYSHLFEHMIFQGSVAVPDTRDFRGRVDGLGAASNGTTSVDRVTYYFTSPSDSLDAALELFAGALQAPALDAAQLEKEKRVVLGEFDLNESDPDFLCYRGALQALYGADATRMEALGSREAVMSATREQLAEMHARYYVPNNSMLVLSGDVTASAARELAERHFAGWARAPDPLAGGVPVPVASAATRYSVLPAEVTLSHIELWWPGPSVESDPQGVLAGELLSDITFQSDHSFRVLVQPGLTFSAGLRLVAQRKAGYVRVNLNVRPGDEAAALSELGDIMNDIGEPGDLTESQLDVAKDEGFGYYLRQADDPSSLAFGIAEGWASEDSRHYFEHVGELYGVSRNDVTRFARTYLRTSPTAVVLMASGNNIATQRIDAAWVQRMVNQ